MSRLVPGTISEIFPYLSLQRLTGNKRVAALLAIAASFRLDGDKHTADELTRIAKRQLMAVERR